MISNGERLIIWYIIEERAGCLDKVVNGYWNTIDQSRSVLGFYCRLRERLVLFPNH